MKAPQCYWPRAQMLLDSFGCRNGCWCPWECLELQRSWKVQANWLPFLTAGQPGTLLRLSRRGNGAGDVRGPTRISSSPRPPNPLVETTSVRLGRFPVPSHVQRKPRAAPAFPGPGSRLPLLCLSRRYSRGKTRRIWPTAGKRGVRGSRGSSRGRETRRFPPFSPPTGDEPMLPARVAAVGVSAMLQGKEWE